MKDKHVEITRTQFAEVRIILGQDNVTRAEIRNFDTLGDVVIVGRGKARWNPIDHFDPQIGQQIALGRALEKFGRKLARYNERLAISEGQHKRNIKEARKDMALLESVNRMYDLWQTIEPIQNGSQQPTTALEAEEIAEEGTDTASSISTEPIEDLEEVENRNRAKLLGNEELT